jgi:hypothetical protein
MAENAFSLTTGVFNNSANFEMRKHIVRGFDPVNAMINETRNFFQSLTSSEDDSARKLKWLIWNLRQSVVLSICPFNSIDLGLEDKYSELEELSKYFPDLIDNIQKVREIISYLLSNSDNPKGKLVRELLENEETQRLNYGIVTALTRGWVSGLEDSYMNEISPSYPECVYISSRKILKDNLFDLIILPSGGRHSPLMYNLTFGGRARELHVVAYEHEQIRLPSIKGLPTGSKNFSTSRAKVVTESSSENQDIQVENWERNNFWSIVRPSSITGQTISGEHQYVVKAKMILLADNSFVFLKEDQKVIELSSILDRRNRNGDKSNSFPRTRASNLDVGDRIVLRTSGSGDYLDQVSGRLMEKDGLSDLSNNALEWKLFFKRALQKYGSSKIMDMLRKRGFGLSSHQYLWVWTTLDVIGPGTDSKFYELIAILDDLGFLPDGSEAIEYAELKWKEMKKLKEYRLKAGSHIRTALLKEMKRIINSGVKIGDRFDFTLPGVSAGTLSIFRVARVDPEVIDVPYCDVSVIKKLEGG